MKKVCSKRYHLCLPLAFLTVSIGCAEGPSVDSFSPPTGAAPSQGMERAQTIDVPEQGQLLTGEPDDVGGAGTSEPSPELMVARVRTRLQFARTEAGRANQVSCDAYDENDSLLAGVPTSYTVSPNVGFERTPEGPVASIAGQYSINCRYEAGNLTDSEGANWEVVAGPAAESQAQVRLEDGAIVESVPAGATFDVDCSYVDRFGNSLDVSDGEVRLQPQPVSFSKEGQYRVRIEASGTYEVFCVGGGVGSTQGVQVSVLPGPPNMLNVARTPTNDTIGINSVVEFNTEVLDAYGNFIPGSNIVIGSMPAAETLGARRLLFSETGVYTVRVTVADSVPALERVFELTVDGVGPAITCLEPPFGSQQIRPATPMAISGQINDLSGVDGVTVSGGSAQLNGGTFSSLQESVWGINAHDVVARDVQGDSSQALCGYFAADQYLSTEDYANDVIGIRIGQAAFDDGAGFAEVGSLGDLLRKVINSEGLQGFIDEQIRALSPDAEIVPADCRIGDADLFGRNFCALTAGLRYQSMQIEGVNDIQLALGDGVIGMEVTLLNLSAQAEIFGQSRANWSLSLEDYAPSRGVVTAEFIRATATISPSLDVSGRLGMQVALDNLTVGDVSADFEGFVVDLAADAAVLVAETFFRDQITDAVREFMEEQVAQTLSELFESIGISGIENFLTVPSLTGTGSAELQFSSKLSSIEVTPDGLFLGAAVRVSPVGAASGPGLGAAVPPGSALLAPPTDQGSAYVDLTLGNQILHGLWSTGFFENEAQSLVSNIAPELAGVELDLDLPSPPAIVGVSGTNKVRVLLGPFRANVRAPSIGVGELLGIKAAALVDVGVALNEVNELVFGPLEVSEVWLSLEQGVLTDDNSRALENLVKDLVQDLVNETLEGSLPKLPIPEFEAPALLTQYGIPPGAVYGLTGITLNAAERGWTGTGQLAERIRAGGCTEECQFSMDGDCDDGGPDSTYSVCDLGSDCTDCGVR